MRVTESHGCHCCTVAAQDYLCKVLTVTSTSTEEPSARCAAGTDFHMIAVTSIGVPVSAALPSCRLEFDRDDRQQTALHPAGWLHQTCLFQVERRHLLKTMLYADVIVTDDFACTSIGSLLDPICRTSPVFFVIAMEVCAEQSSLH